MFSCTMLLSALALTLLAVTVEASTGGGTPNHNYDLSGAALTRLYNSRVYKAERMKRPLDGTTFVAGPISHSGVRVTLADGTQWLIHKGGNYGISSNTVVTAVRHMSPGWRVVKEGNFQGRKTVADFVATGGSNYDLLFDNCHWASIRMMNQVTLADGTQWLIHKGGNYGISSNTVVTAVRHMSPGWRVVTVGDFKGRKTVADFVETGGSDYNLLFDNCHWASIRMMNQ